MYSVCGVAGTGNNLDGDPVRLTSFCGLDRWEEIPHRVIAELAECPIFHHSTLSNLPTERRTSGISRQYCAGEFEEW